jgi:hypothetical protein
MARMTCNYWLSSTECETLAAYLNDIESGLTRLGKARYALSSSEKESLFNMEQSCTGIRQLLQILQDTPAQEATLVA